MNSYLRDYRARLAHSLVIPSFGLLFLRIVAGSALMFHGFGKIQNPFHWMGEGAPVPGFFQFLAALSEFGGGFCLIIGFIVPLASLGIAITMAVATLKHVNEGAPFVGHPVAYEPALLYFALAVFFLCNGPGRYSVDRKIFS